MNDTNVELIAELRVKLAAAQAAIKEHNERWEGYRLSGVTQICNIKGGTAALDAAIAHATLELRTQLAAAQAEVKKWEDESDRRDFDEADYRQKMVAEIQARDKQLAAAQAKSESIRNLWSTHELTNEKLAAILGQSNREALDAAIAAATKLIRELCESEVKQSVDEATKPLVDALEALRKGATLGQRAVIDEALKAHETERNNNESMKATIENLIADLRADAPKVPRQLHGGLSRLIVGFGSEYDWKQANHDAASFLEQYVVQREPEGGG